MILCCKHCGNCRESNHLAENCDYCGKVSDTAAVRFSAANTASCADGTAVRAFFMQRPAVGRGHPDRREGPFERFF